MSRRATKTWGVILQVYNTLAVTTTTEMEATLVSVIFTTSLFVTDSLVKSMPIDIY